MRRRFGLFFLTGLLAGAWLFHGFWQEATVERPQPDAPVEAIVVLTGGGARVAAGLKLFAEGAADRLYISGANDGVVVQDLLAQGPDLSAEAMARIELGRARDTAGNAAETAAWVSANNVESFILVTAYYHLPRSLALFRAAMPQAEIWPHAVDPAAATREHWSETGRGVTLILGEFLKYLATRAGFDR